MQNFKDNSIIVDENRTFQLAIYSVIGDREEQQDSFGYEINSDDGLIIVCDGMGGHEGGKKASNLAVSEILSSYSDNYPCSDIRHLILNSMKTADEKISNLTHQDGSQMNSGTTAVLIAIQDRQLHWFSAGDSRAYLFRNDEFVRLTSDHIYKALLDEKLVLGEISAEEYESELPQGEALISFLGVGDLSVINSNETAFGLESEDKILLMSDGLYKIVSDEEIKRVIDNFTNLEEAVKALDMKANQLSQKRNINRDNMTIALIKIK